MAALYNKDAYDGKERVLEICYTDLKHTYQIKLDDKGSEVLTDQSLTPTTRIDTPFTVWSAISRGEIGGAEALGKQMYTVTGDFSLMVNWDKFFGSTSAVKRGRKNITRCGGAEKSFHDDNAHTMDYVLDSSFCQYRKRVCDCSFGGGRYAFYNEKTQICNMGSAFNCGCCHTFCDSKPDRSR